MESVPTCTGPTADLREANLHGANLHGADLRCANLSGADLHGADLHGADLRGADLRRANLHGADLREADLDFACWPLTCGSFGAKADMRLVAQLAKHLAMLDVSDCCGGIREAMENFRRTGLAHLFDEYRDDIPKTPVEEEVKNEEANMDYAYPCGRGAGENIRGLRDGDAGGMRVSQAAGTGTDRNGEE